MEDIVNSFWQMRGCLDAVTDIDKISASLVKTLSEMFGAQKVSFMLLDESRKELCVKAAQGLSPEATASKTKVGESFSGWVAKEEKPLLVKDVSEEYPQMARERLMRYGTKSFVVVPVKTNDNIYGVLNLTEKQGDAAFTEEDMKVLTLISSYLALHIENRQFLEKNKILSAVDPLTELYNHRYFYEELGEEIYRAERYHHHLSVLVMDVDDFAAYNQSYGHACGDNVLKQIARIIRENTRQTDIPCRFGGEEFVVILPETKLAEAVVVSEKIRERINEAIFTEDESRASAFGMAKFTVSIGVAEHKIGLEKEELVHRVLSALTEAKRQGKNRVWVYK